MKKLLNVILIFAVAIMTFACSNKVVSETNEGQANEVSESKEQVTTDAKDELANDLTNYINEIDNKTIDPTIYLDYKKV